MMTWGVVSLLVLAGLGWLLLFANRRTFGWIAPAGAPNITQDGVVRSTVWIPTPSGSRIEGWLYHSGGAPPVIVMAPGLAGTKEGPLERFAWGFARAGFAVVSFDFRSFGGSEGLPRHDIDPRAHVADFAAVIAHVRAGRIEGVDASRVALWGTSFSGASALCTAASLEAPAAAVVLHVPYLGKPAQAPGFVQMLGYVGLVLGEMAGDALAKLFGAGLHPVYIAAYGKPGEGAFGASRDCPSRRNGASDHSFWKALPETYRGGWRNLMLVRGVQHLDAIDPPAALSKARCPVMLVAATHDDMIHIVDTRELCAKSEGDIRLVEIEGGHFDPYVDPWFAPNLAGQVEFLRTVLGAEARWTAAG
ncbi:MAG: alpha/beta fold hydrolase [Hyphomonadaceae bacterium]|nr:alpha/beta fold hydrolase [Hyphomonadaceae bacterium]